MGIDFAMAVDTVPGCVAKDTGCMAGVAFRLGMRAEQRKLRQVVVKEHVFLPGVLGMAIETLRSLGSFVRVIVLVA